MPFWKADQPATRWRRLRRNTRDTLGLVAAGKLAEVASPIGASRSRRRPPRPVIVAALVTAVAAVVWVARSVKGKAASEEASSAEPAPTTAASPAEPNANGSETPQAQKGRAAS